MKIRPYGRVFFVYARHGRAAGGRAGGMSLVSGGKSTGRFSLIL